MSYLKDDADRIRAHMPVEVSIPDDSDMLFLMYAVLGRAKGVRVTPEDIHDAWVAWMEASGKEHDAMKPFDELDRDTRVQDLPFVIAVKNAFVP